MGINETLDLDRRKTRLAWIGRIAASVALIIAAGSIWVLVQRSPERELGQTETQEASPDLQNDQTGLSETAVPEVPATGPSVPGPIVHPANADQFLAGPGTEKLSFAAEEDQGPPVLIQAEEDAGGLVLTAERLLPINRKYIARLSDAGPRPEPMLAVHHQEQLPLYTGEGIDVFEEFGDESSDYDRWAVGGQVTPLYSYRNLGTESGNAYSSTGYYNDIENGIVSYAGGINLNYSPAKRLSLQSGIYYSRMGMSVQNTYIATLGGNAYVNDFPSLELAMDNSSGQIEFGTEKSNSFLANLKLSGERFFDANTAVGSTEESAIREGDVLQHFEYLEVPVILRYRVVDRRVGLNVLGGLSTNFLVGSNVYFQENGNKEFIGTTADLKPVNYSGVMGLGLQYSISRNFHINMEPTFRYYLNSINKASGINSHPYSLGFFTGISYSF